MSEAHKIIRENLRKTQELESAVAIVRSAELSEAARLLKGESAKKVRDFFKKAFGDHLVCADMLSLCNQVAEPKKNKDKQSSPAKVAIMKTPLYMSAARKLTGHIPSVQMTECHDFRSACEEVSLGHATYCILPFCSSQDGYYPTFAKLIKAYELKIVSLCRLTKSDSDEELQFALLSKELQWGKNAKNLVFAFVEDETVSLADMVCAISGAGGIPYSITSVPLAYNMDKLEHRIEVRLNDLTPEGTALFLEAALQSHTLIGIY